MTYLIHAGILLAGCFAYYWLVLRRETYFGLNRWVLLGGLLGSLPRGAMGTFTLERAAGTMSFKGLFDGNDGLGNFTFTPPRPSPSNCATPAWVPTLSSRRYYSFSPTSTRSTWTTSPARNTTRTTTSCWNWPSSTTTSPSSKPA